MQCFNITFIYIFSYLPNFTNTVTILVFRYGSDEISKFRVSYNAYNIFVKIVRGMRSNTNFLINDTSIS